MVPELNKGFHISRLMVAKTLKKLLLKKKNDYVHLWIQNYDLFACEAQYHESCRKEYTRDPSAWRSKDADAVNLQSDLEEAHVCAFQNIIEYIQHEVIDRKRIDRLSSLKETYTTVLDMLNCPSSSYDSRKLMHKIEKHPTIGAKVIFKRLT